MKVQLKSILLSKTNFYTMKQIIILSVIALMLASCRSKKEEPKAAVQTNENMVTLTDAQLKNAGIQKGKLEQQSISSVLKVNGKIDVPPQNMVSISVPLGGYLKSSKLLPGMHIKLIGVNPNKIGVNNISRSINIYSPINGFVSAVNVNIGKYVNPSDVLFELVNPTDIHLALTIFEKILTSLRLVKN